MVDVKHVHVHVTLWRLRYAIMEFCLELLRPHVAMLGGSAFEMPAQRKLRWIRALCGTAQLLTFSLLICTCYDISPEQAKPTLPMEFD